MFILRSDEFFVLDPNYQHVHVYQYQCFSRAGLFLRTEGLHRVVSTEQKRQAVGEYVQLPEIADRHGATADAFSQVSNF